MPAAPATRAAVPREDTTGSNATEERGSKDASASFVSAGNRRFPAYSHSDYCRSFWYRPHDGVRSYRYTGIVITIRTPCVLPTLRELGDFPLAVRTPCVLTTSRKARSAFRTTTEQGAGSAGTPCGCAARENRRTESEDRGSNDGSTSRRSSYRKSKALP